MTRPADETAERTEDAPVTDSAGPTGAVSAEDSPQAPAEAASPESGDEPEPDVGFTLSESPPVEDVAERAGALMHQVARELGAAGPEGWQRVDAVFAMTVATEAASVVFSDDQGGRVGIDPSAEILGLVREHRHLSAGFGDGPWWRLLFTLSRDGRLEVDYDYGDEPFPDDQLYPPEVYRADLEVYPRGTLPIWLSAYLGHGDAQLRPPRLASAQARADREAGVSVTPVPDLPPFPLMAARWAVLAAAFVAVESEWGPRLLPSLSWFEGAKRSGSSLYALPGRRAVLSGGVWNAPELATAYQQGGALPRLFAGAPEWVAAQVVNHRATSGMLTFCYWWDGGRWYRGESPAAEQIAEAVPGIWTADSVVDIVSGLLGDAGDRHRAAVERLVAAAESGTVTRAALADVFDAETFDVDGAMFQLTMGGVTTTAPQPMLEQDAIAKVVRHLLDSGEDLAEFPVEQLQAERIDVGWMVYVPVAPGEIAVGRAIFYVADDGVLERSSSSIAPSRYIGEFVRRFRERHGAPGRE